MQAAPTRTPLADVAAARRSLRAQIARLEGELAVALARTYPHLAVPRPIEHQGPRLLGLEELERTRDALAARVVETRHAETRQRARQADARALLEAMLADPAAHPGARVTNAELGLPGCTTYEVRPRFLTKWWRVKVSSGCP
jgi:hypothetical protein